MLCTKHFLTRRPLGGGGDVLCLLLRQTLRLLSQHVVRESPKLEHRGEKGNYTVRGTV